MNREMRDIVIKPERHRWFVWRDLVTLLLAFAVVLLVRQVGDLRTQLDKASALRTQQLAQLNTRLGGLQSRLKQAQQQAAAKDKRIRQLTDQLLKAGLTPVRATAAAEPTPVPHPSPSGPRPTPAPTATPPPTTRPPSPTPSPTCTHLPIIGTCRPGR